MMQAYLYLALILFLLSEYLLLVLLLYQLKQMQPSALFQKKAQCSEPHVKTAAFSHAHKTPGYSDK